MLAVCRSFSATVATRDGESSKRSIQSLAAPLSPRRRDPRASVTRRAGHGRTGCTGSPMSHGPCGQPCVGPESRVLRYGCVRLWAAGPAVPTAPVTPHMFDAMCAWRGITRQCRWGSCRGVPVRSGDPLAWCRVPRLGLPIAAGGAPFSPHSRRLTSHLSRVYSRAARGAARRPHRDHAYASRVTRVTAHSSDLTPHRAVSRDVTSDVDVSPHDLTRIILEVYLVYSFASSGLF